MQLVMPTLNMLQSAHYPATSEVHADLGEERPNTTCHGQVSDTVPPPTLSFDEIMQRQESLGLSSALRVPPALSRESSLNWQRQETFGLSSDLQMPDLGRETSLSFICDNICI
jgi:hypothetical protein